MKTFYQEPQYNKIGTEMIRHQIKTRSLMHLEILVVIVVIKSITDLKIYHYVYDLFLNKLRTMESLKPLIIIYCIFSSIIEFHRNLRKTYIPENIFQLCNYFDNFIPPETGSNTYTRMLSHSHASTRHRIVYWRVKTSSNKRILASR